MGTAAAVSEWTPYAQPSPGARRIDVHHHFTAPVWKKRMAESRRQGLDTFQMYDVSRSLDAMDRAGFRPRSSPRRRRAPDVSVVDVASRMVKTKIKVGHGPWGLAVVPAP